MHGLLSESPQIEYTAIGMQKSLNDLSKPAELALSDFIRHEIQSMKDILESDDARFLGNKARLEPNMWRSHVIEA